MKNARRLILVLLLMLIFCSVLSVKASTWLPVASTWSIVTVDSTDYSYEPSLALDSKGRPHISYKDIKYDDLKYAFWDGNSWAISMVDSTYYAGYNPSLELDRNDQPHISYVVRWIHGFEKTIQEGNSLAITEMNFGGSEELFFAKQDSKDSSHFSFKDNQTNYDKVNFDMETDYLKYTVKEGNSWKITTIDSVGDAFYSSLRLDSKDRPHISCDDDYLRYVVWDGSSWIVSTVTSKGGGGAYPSLALDSNDLPHICYLDSTNIIYSDSDGSPKIDDTKGVLKYARFNGSSWEIMTVDSVGNGMDINLELDSKDRPHISYSDKTTHNLKYAVLEGDSWNITPVDSASVVTFSSLALDNYDRPHISYSDIANDMLKYTRFTGTEWEIMTVDSGFADSSLVLDNDDCPHISYVANNTLKYAVLNDAFVLSSPLSAPLNLQATVENGKIALSWSAPTFDGGSTVTNYNIYRGTASGNGTLLTTVGNETFFVDESVENDIMYYYQVSAVNLAGEGAKSNTATVKLNQPFIQVYSVHIILIAVALAVGLVVTMTVVRRLSLRSVK